MMLIIPVVLIGHVLFQPVVTDNILLVFNIHKSHVNMLIHAAEGLANTKHIVYAALPKWMHGFDDVLFQIGIHKLSYHDPYSAGFINNEVWNLGRFDAILNNDGTILREIDRRTYQKNIIVTEAALSDKSFMQNARNLDFSLAIIVGFYMGRCWALIPYELGIPFIGAFNTPFPWTAGVPALPSFVLPEMLPYTHDMNFFQRGHNLMTTIHTEVYPAGVANNYTLLRKHVSDDVIQTWNDLAASASMFLITVDPVLRWPEPIMPNMQYLGPVTAREAHPLLKELEEFISLHREGFILMSLGTHIGKWPEAFRIEIARALSLLNKSVGIILKYPNQDILNDSNILVLPWMDQNDLLGHPDIQLFVTHCGSNSLNEAVYHGVPLVGIPLFADQHLLGALLEAKGFGRTLQVQGLKADSLYKTITEVLRNDTYRHNVHKASRIMRSRPLNASQHMMYWVEHLLEFGDSHLRSAGAQLPWYQYFMLDIAATFILGLVVLIVLSTLCVVFTFSRFSGELKREKLE